MTVFKTFLKILKKNLSTVILYTVILVVFAGFNMQTNENSISFNAVKPDILIINNDKEAGLTKGFIDYIKENSNTPKVDITSEEKILDALFYNDVDYIIYIPEGFSNDLVNGTLKELEVKKSNNFNAACAEMIVNRYLTVANNYRYTSLDEERITNDIAKALESENNVEINTKLDTDTLARAAFYYNFSSYSIMACLIFIICMVLSTFNSEKIRKRTVISSTNYKKHNRLLLLSNLTYALIIWLIYVILSFILVGDIMFTSNGILLIINSLIYLFTVTTLAFLLGTLVSNKDAINGIMNVVALGSSFLCGVFVPQSYLPNFVLNIGKVLPTYYYITSNEKIALLESINLDTLTPVLINMGVLVAFSITFIVITNIVSNRKRKIG